MKKFERKSWNVLLFMMIASVTFITSCGPLITTKTYLLNKDDPKMLSQFTKSIGKQYWVLANKYAQIFRAPSVSSDKVIITETTSFIIEDIIIKEYESPYKDEVFYKIKLASGQIGYIKVDTHKYSKNNPLEGEFWIRTEDPKIVKERQRLEAEKKLDELGILKDKSLWLRYPMLSKGFLSFGLQEVRIRDFEIYEGAIRTSVKFYLYAKDQEDIIIFDLSTLTTEITTAFYLTDPFPRIKKEKWGTNILKAIEYHRFVIGMTEEQAILSVGRPNEINRSVGSWGVHEQWVYRNCRIGGGLRNFYLYFENGKLTSWQE